jgi:hypothetical protein
MHSARSLPDERLTYVEGMALDGRRYLDLKVGDVKSQQIQNHSHDGEYSPSLMSNTQAAKLAGLGNSRSCSRRRRLRLRLRQAILAASAFDIVLPIP